MPLELLTTSYYLGDRLAEIRETILDVYAAVYAADIATDPFFSMERFEERLEMHTAAGGWGCVIAEIEGAAVGFTYGFTARDDARTFKVCENMLCEKWRKQGISRLMHDELVSHREEACAELLVRRSRPRLRAMYEAWGYRHISERQPFPDSPLYDVMALPLT
ncbi:hypothetical protein ACZ90_69645 [Streptomyces albus subsp. albus]|nr:hypothetical protein ACZ90_69645 [Streptomyces albus subsp. albus]